MGEIGVLREHSIDGQIVKFWVGNMTLISVSSPLLPLRHALGIVCKISALRYVRFVVLEYCVVS